VKLPLEVERHRRRPDRFIVGPEHAYDDTLVGVADQFLVVEANGSTRSPRRSSPRAPDPRAGGEAARPDPHPLRDVRPTLIFFTREKSGPARRM
jgi:hypothetical protein